jgi:short subunit dehydrogenase-like uncharacterized protein
LPDRWLIYGAYGFTGRLIVEEALRRGHRPALAGRSAKKLIPLAESSGLDHRVFDLDDLQAVVRAIRDYALVLHCAGPYVLTADPMLRACMLAGAHYLDLTGEIRVYEQNYAYDEAARKQGRVIISGVGFDVVPSDCLAAYVAAKLPDATHLEIAFRVQSQASAGTVKSVAENGPGGFWVRRQGVLTPLPMGAGARKVRFSDGGDYTVMPIPWGDLSTAFRSTGIPNITTYMSFSPLVPPLLRIIGPLAQVALSLQPVRQILKAGINLLFHGPGESQQAESHAYIWAQVRNDAGETAEAWLETPEPYRYTALSAVAAVERVLADQPAGVLSPAQAFGADFTLGIDGVRRLDQL